MARHGWVTLDDVADGFKLEADYTVNPRGFAAPILTDAQMGALIMAMAVVNPDLDVVVERLSVEFSDPHWPAAERITRSGVAEPWDFAQLDWCWYIITGAHGVLNTETEGE
jgi:hypothetical protein